MSADVWNVCCNPELSFFNLWDAGLLGAQLYCSEIPMNWSLSKLFKKLCTLSNLSCPKCPSMTPSAVLCIQESPFYMIWFIFKTQLLGSNERETLDFLSRESWFFLQKCGTPTKMGLHYKATTKEDAKNARSPKSRFFRLDKSLLFTLSPKIILWHWSLQPIFELWSLHI
jgi:hypothetical protein